LVADGPDVAAVVVELVMDLGRVGSQRALGGGDRRQFLVIDLDQLGGVLGLEIALGNDHGDVVADVAHLVLRQRRVGRFPHGVAVDVGDQPAAGQAADLVGLEVFAGEYRQHAGRRQCGTGVDAADAGVGVRRAQEIGIGLAVEADVVGVAALAAQEALILAPLDGFADTGLVHASCSFIWTAAACTALTMLW